MNGRIQWAGLYLLFQTLLPLFWTLICMIWMELTRTDAVFSRIALMLFMCRNKSSRNDLKLHGTYFWKILKILEEESTSGGPPPVHEGGGRACPLGRAPLPRGPPDAPPTSTPTPKSPPTGDTSPSVSTFPNSFALVLDSNLHDLNGTNLDWRCF